MNNGFKTTLTLVAIASLAACGGGDDNTSAVPQGFTACTIDINAYGAAYGLGSVPAGTSASITSSLTCDQLNANIKSTLNAGLAELARLNGLVTTADARVAAAVRAGQASVDAKQVELNTANIRAAEAVAAAARADVALQQAVVARTAAQALAVQAQADLSAAQTETARVTAALSVSQAETVAATAAKAIADATAAQALADKLVAETAAATAQARIVMLSARIVELETLVAAGGGNAALLTQIASLQSDLAAAVLNTQTQVAALQVQLAAVNAALTVANGDKVALTAQVAALTAQVASLQTQLAAAGSGGNNTGLPFCVGNPSPIAATTTFAGAGTACVVSYADQKAVADAIKAAADAAAAAAAAVKVDGIYISPTLFMIAEADGKTWMFDQKTPDAVFGSVFVAGSTGLTFSAPSKSLSYTHGDVAVVGSYVKQASATFTMNYAGGATVSHTGTYDPAFDTALVMPSKKMIGQDFYTGSHDLEITIASGGATFTGREVTCTFAGTFGQTTKGYNKVTITWGANCAVPAGTVGSGVVGKYGDNFVMMTNQAGAFADVGFVAIFEGGAAPVALNLGERAKALSASRIGAR